MEASAVAALFIVSRAASGAFLKCSVVRNHSASGVKKELLLNKGTPSQMSEAA